MRSAGAINYRVASTNYATLYGRPEPEENVSLAIFVSYYRIRDRRARADAMRMRAVKMPVPYYTRLALHAKAKINRVPALRYEILRTSHRRKTFDSINQI